MESLDADSIYQVAIDCYNKAQVSATLYSLPVTEAETHVTYC